MKKDTGQRNLSSLAYHIICKRENKVTKAHLRLTGEGRMRFCEDWKAMNSIDRTRNFQLIINSVDKL